MPANTREILAAFATVLVNDPVLTDPAVGILPSTSPDSLPASRANSIFYARPPVPRGFPCIVLTDVITRPAIRDQQDRKNRRVMVAINVEVWGQSAGGSTQVDLGAVTSEIDGVIEGTGSNGACWWGGAMDTSDWQFTDVATDGVWHAYEVSEAKSSRVIERRLKTYWVTAADKT